MLEPHFDPLLATQVGYEGCEKQFVKSAEFEYFLRSIDVNELPVVEGLSLKILNEWVSSRNFHLSIDPNCSQFGSGEATFSSPSDNIVTEQVELCAGLRLLFQKPNH